MEVLKSYDAPFHGSIICTWYIEASTSALSACGQAKFAFNLDLRIHAYYFGQYSQVRVSLIWKRFMCSNHQKFQPCMAYAYHWCCSHDLVFICRDSMSTLMLNVPPCSTCPLRLRIGVILIFPSLFYGFLCFFLIINSQGNIWSLQLWWWIHVSINHLFKSYPHPTRTEQIL